jgi:PAS domain-containing protein
VIGYQGWDDAEIAITLAVRIEDCMAELPELDSNGRVDRRTGGQDTPYSRLDAAVLASSQLYRALLDNMTEGVSLSDEGGIILYTNPTEDVMFGYDPGELLGQHVSVQTPILTRKTGGACSGY